MGETHREVMEGEMSEKDPVATWRGGVGSMARMEGKEDRVMRTLPRDMGV